MEKKFISQIQVMYAEKSESEKKYSMVAQEMRVSQQKYTDLEVNFQLKVEHAKS